MKKKQIEETMRREGDELLKNKKSRILSTYVTTTTDQYKPRQVIFSKKFAIAATASVLAVALLAGLPFMFGNDGNNTGPFGAEWTTLNGVRVEYLTTRTFVPEREGGMVSEEFRTAAAKFAFDLFDGCKSSRGSDGLLVSPLSTMLALSMAANGAEDETLAELTSVLAGGMDIESLNRELFNYTSSLASSEDAKFNLANSLWVTSSPHFSVNDSYINTIENTFDADIISVDMSKKKVVNAVNSWASCNTDGMIDSILKDGDISPQTLMLLINALCFDAIWDEQEPDTASAAGPFNKTETATYMRTGCNGYIDGDNETGIVKNYKGGKYAFVALLPDEDTDIYDYAATLDGEEFLQLFDGRTKATSTSIVTGKIPFFESDYSVDLNDALQGMGVTRAFNVSKAQFGGLGASEMGNAYISRVIHKTYIQLDNSGTRAAAVTAIEIAPTSSAPSTVTYYRVELDRPFVYAIVDTQTGLPIFLGVCESVE